MADIMAGGDEQPMRGPPQPQGGMDPGLMAMVQAVLAKVGPQVLAQVLQMLLRQSQGGTPPNLTASPMQPGQRPPPGPGGPPGAGMGMMGPQ